MQRHEAKTERPRPRESSNEAVDHYDDGEPYGNASKSAAELTRLPGWSPGLNHLENHDRMIRSGPVPKRRQIEPFSGFDMPFGENC